MNAGYRKGGPDSWKKKKEKGSLILDGKKFIRTLNEMRPRTGIYDDSSTIQPHCLSLGVTRGG